MKELEGLEGLLQYTGFDDGHNFAVKTIMHCENSNAL